MNSFYKPQMEKIGDQNFPTSSFKESCLSILYRQNQMGNMCHSRNLIPDYLYESLNDTTPINIGDCRCCYKKMLSTRVFWEQEYCRYWGRWSRFWCWYVDIVQTNCSSYIALKKIAPTMKVARRWWCNWFTMLVWRKMRLKPLRDVGQHDVSDGHSMVSPNQQWCERPTLT